MTAIFSHSGDNMDPFEAKAYFGQAQVSGRAGAFSTQDAEVAGHNAALALTLLRMLPHSAYLMRADGRITFMNQAGALRLKTLQPVVPAPAPRRRLWWEIWPDADEITLRQALDQAFLGEASELDLHCPGITGAPVRCAVTLVPIEDLSGEITKALCIARE